MELTALRDAFDRVIKKQKLTTSKTQEMIDVALQKIETKIQSTDNATCPIDNNSPVATDYGSLLEELRTKPKAISHAKKLLETSVKVLTKLVDKHFIQDISKACWHMEYDSSTLNLIITTHFYRQGLFDLGDTFMKEAVKDSAIDASKAAALRQSFNELYRISNALKSGHLEPALNWAVVNRETGLELKLCRIQFVEILKKGRMHLSEALLFAKNHLQPLTFVHSPTEVLKSVVLLLWAGRLERSPYRNLEIISQGCAHLERVNNELKQRFFSGMGQCCECPLETVIEAGVECLLVLLKLGSMLHLDGVNEELPVPVELGKGFHFHSVFVCPVLRERASDDNPPMLMPCGHVISLYAIAFLSGVGNHPFKCPCCPSEVDASLCREIYF